MRRLIGIIGLLLIMGFLYGKYVEPNNLKVNEFVIANSKIPKEFEGFKILHFSDVLYRSENDLVLLDKVVKETIQSNVDIIVFTGDLINKDISEDESKTLIGLLNDMTAKQYKYAILGDNDNNDVKHILEESHFIILDETPLYVFNEGIEPIKIVNGTEYASDEEDQSKEYIISLIHKPDDYDKTQYDLVLAGHSLGGEIRIPYLGAFFKKEGANKYTDSFYHNDDSILYVSYGLGSEKTQLRLFNSPSINIYRLATL